MLILQMGKLREITNYLGVTLGKSILGRAKI